MNKVIFVAIHLLCFAVIWVGVSPIAVAACVFMYVIRMFAITAGYHRLFSHRSYKTSRWFQFVMAALGASSAQKGPLWWAALHRHHHRHSDTEEDIHSPGLHGLWWAHAGWVLSKDHDKADYQDVKDLMAFPELRWIENYHYVPALMIIPFTFLLGVVLNNLFPSLGTSGFQMLVWAGFISTVFLYHGTFAINSLAHMMGKKRFETGDRSLNSFILAIITLGEGWHNNHHRYPGSERQGFYWWEIDISHYMLVLLFKLGIVWDLRVPPARIYAEAAAGLKKS